VSVLFLDPLALGLLVGLVAYVWHVWRGGYRRWFGRADGWTVAAWPLPLVVMAVPAFAGAVFTALGWLGWSAEEHGIVGAAAYGIVYGVPLVLGTLVPPRWLLPGWSRRRLTYPAATTPGPRMWPRAALRSRTAHGRHARMSAGRLPDAARPSSQGTDATVDGPPPDATVDGPPLDATVDGPPPDALPAMLTRRGHGSLARWVWAVDAVAGHVWLDARVVRFRATPAPDRDHAPVRARVLVDEDLGEPVFTATGEVRVVAPRGGRWSHDDIELDLAAVDAWRTRATRPWRRDGVLEIEVAGRAPLQLWVADLRPTARWLAPAA
jgi:hypothetical protein